MLKEKTMRDRFKRNINYLRVSVTDRCQFRCFYCTPVKVNFTPMEKLLSLEDFKRLAHVFEQLGIEFVRITGGEPTVRQDIVQIVEVFSSFSSVSMTTNGCRLERIAQDLKNAGLSSVNISLDTLKDEQFYTITGSNKLKNVIRGIEKAIETNISVKLNSVVYKDNLEEVLDLALFAGRLGVPIRFIELMPVGSNNEQYFVQRKSIIEKLKPLKLKSTSVRLGNGPADYFITDSGNYIGLISAVSKNFCHLCNKIRLSCDGKLYPCLGHTKNVDLMIPLRSSSDDVELRKTIETAIFNKPAGHDMKHSIVQTSMRRIGG